MEIKKRTMWPIDNNFKQQIFSFFVLRCIQTAMMMVEWEIKPHVREATEAASKQQQIRQMLFSYCNVNALQSHYIYQDRIVVTRHPKAQAAAYILQNASL